MADFVILTETCCDLPPALADELGLSVIPIAVRINDIDFMHYLDEREMSTHDFYELVRHGATTSTAAANVLQFKDYMEPILDAGKDVLYMGFSSALSSGTANAAALAAEELRERYPERKIVLTDTLAASGGQGLLVWYAACRQQEGKSIEEVRDYIEETKLHIGHWFTVDDLNYLHRGGRVSGVSAVLGTMLNIKPVLHTDDEGRLIFVEKARGRKASIKRMVDHMLETATNIADQTIIICHADCLDDAEYMASLLEDKVKKIVYSYIGPVIGAHCGTGTLALFFMGTHR